MSFTSTKFDSVPQSTANSVTTVNASLFKGASKQYNISGGGTGKNVAALSRNENVIMTMMNTSLASHTDLKSPTAAKAMRKNRRKKSPLNSTTPRSETGESGVFLSTNNAEEPPQQKKHNISSVS